MEGPVKPLQVWRQRDPARADLTWDEPTAGMGAEGNEGRHTSRVNNSPEGNNETVDPGGVKSRGSISVEMGGVVSDPGGPIRAKPGGTETTETGNVDTEISSSSGKRT